MALITSHWYLDGILFLLFLTILAYLYVTRQFKYWKKRGVMELPPTPFLGNFTDALMLKKSPGCFTKDLYDASKGLPYMGFYIFDKPFFLPRDPDLIKHILIKDSEYFPDRYAKTDPNDNLGRVSLFLIKNPAWKVLRADLKPLYSSGKLKKMFDLMVEVGKDLDTHLEEVMEDETECVMEMKDLWGKYMTDMIATTAFGLRVNSLNDPDAAFRKYGKKILDYNLWRGIEFLIMFFLPPLTKWIRLRLFPDDVVAFLRRVFCDIVEHRIESGVKRNDLIDLLLELQNKKKDLPAIHGFKYDEDCLLSQAANFFNAGFETSSTTVSFSLYELALHPEIQDKLRKDILNALGNTNGQITYDMMKAVPYLDMVISETLRKYPPLPFLDRVAVADYKVPNSNLILEKGTPVYIPMLGLHLDPQYFPNPDKYDPERFSEENKRNIQPYTYFPFGEGPHMCIAARLGVLQTKLGLIQVLKKYEVSVCEKTTIPVQIDPKGFTTTPLGGVYLKLRKMTNLSI